jgi:hypothetical protein
MASLTDRSALLGQPEFRARVEVAVTEACVNVMAENISTGNQRFRDLARRAIAARWLAGPRGDLLEAFVRGVVSDATLDPTDDAAISARIGGVYDQVASSVIESALRRGGG